MSTANRSYGESALVTPANALTLFRLVITPVFMWLIISRGPSWWTTLVGAFAAFSDYFDGIVARRQGPTRSGAFLDPLADKVAVLGSLYTLVYVHRMFWVPVAIITLREMWMSYFRSRAAQSGISIPARQLAKYKTLVQDWAIAFCVIPWTSHVHPLQVATLWLAVALTVVTGGLYYLDGRRASAE